MTYKLRLGNFDGPLDLLLHLIKVNEVDIYDIPIAVITDQYIEYLDMMKELDLEIASEFLVMAATLMEIKSRMLLPTQTVEEEPEEDPRFELIEQILEYKKYKEADKQTIGYDHINNLLFFLLHSEFNVQSGKYINLMY